MKSHTLTYFITLVIISMMLLSCTDEWRRSKKTSIWTASDPTTISYNIRMKEYKSGNLVPNFSFEDGTPLSSDTSTVQQIKKWTIIGQGVMYLENTPDSVYTNFGKRCICIKKNKISETDTLGEGIMSDFIPVLPGNYTFSVQLKANDIVSQYERYGAPLMQSIHIRIIYFDERRHELSSTFICPLSGKNIDIGFKGYGFSGYHNISSMPWTTIIGRSFLYPFFEGDFPDQCRYVKIFIGLKGSGTLWVDDVNLRFSKWNFTATERMNWYKDSVLTSDPIIIPTPQYIKFTKKIPLIYAGVDNVLYPSIVLNFPNQHLLSDISARTLKQNIEKILKKNYPDCIVNEFGSIDQNTINNSSVIFLLTSYSRVDTLMQSEIIPGFSSKSQGYLITDTILNNKRIIILAAPDDLGLWYAVQTLSALFDENGTLNFANIIDFPSFSGRSFYVPHGYDPSTIEQWLEFMTSLRFNKAYVSVHQNENDFFLPNSVEFLPQELKQTATFASEKKFLKYGVILNYPINYMLETPYEKNAENKIATEIESMFRMLKPIFENGASFLLLNNNQQLSFNQLDRQKNKSIYLQTLAKSLNIFQKLSETVRLLYEKLNALNSNIVFEFNPYWNTNDKIILNRVLSYIYFANLQQTLPADISYHWQGNCAKTHFFDKNDIQYFQYITEHPVIFNYSTLSACEDDVNGISVLYKGKIQICNLFEPFNLFIPKGFSEISPNFVITDLKISEIDKIHLATIADYLWNPDAYNPEISLWKILIKQFGKDLTLQIVSFNDLYFKILKQILSLETSMKEKKSLLKSTEIAYGKLNEILNNTETQFASINPQFHNELILLSEQLGKRISRIKTHINPQTDTIQDKPQP